MYNFAHEGHTDSLLDNSVHHLKTESEREWNRMSDEFVNAGYREGITAGKESAVQGGFDAGFADVGAPIGRQLGNLRGLAAGALSFLQSPRASTSMEEGCGNLIQEVRYITEGLARLQFTKLVPPDDEALAHARDHAESDVEDLQVSADASAARRKALEDLNGLQQRLERVLLTLKLDSSLPLPDFASQL